jgi:hypothetical protein
MMNQYDVVPLRGVGPVLLGMVREEVHVVMGPQSQLLQKVTDDASTIEAYHEGGFQVFFDESDEVEYIELSSFDHSFAAMYRGREVFTTRARELLDLISAEASFDPEDPEIGYSYIFPELQLSLWRPVILEDDEDSEGRYFSTIGIGRHGYYS